ncbi:hypothetical protein [Variovorax soli]|uniref:Uncharacterized protein n=1 Tax=Variovorax soli TaxID=376815 RepID=A0ABU1NKX9_9BURK|nr:hypothetical protein [Variovorax soli]MDR6539114.1 hypothetical protein [Variovorax soli]
MRAVPPRRELLEPPARAADGAIAGGGVLGVASRTALALPYLPFVAVLGFVPLPAAVVIAMIVLTLAYVAAAEVAKRFFYVRR